MVVPGSDNNNNNNNKISQLYKPHQCQSSQRSIKSIVKMATLTWLLLEIKHLFLHNHLLLFTSRVGCHSLIDRPLYLHRASINYKHMSSRSPIHETVILSNNVFNSNRRWQTYKFLLKMASLKMILYNCGCGRNRVGIFHWCSSREESTASQVSESTASQVSNREDQALYFINPRARLSCPSKVSSDVVKA